MEVNAISSGQSYPGGTQLPGWLAIHRRRATVRPAESTRGNGVPGSQQKGGVLFGEGEGVARSGLWEICVNRDPA